MAEIDPTAHRMPLAMAWEVEDDCFATVQQMVMAVANQQPQTEIKRLRDQALAQYETYLDLMAEAGHHAGKLKP